MRLIDADAYAAEMKVRQDACKDWLDEARTRLNLDAVGLARQALTTFFEAKLTLDKTPTVDAVKVVRCKDCDFYMEAPWGGDMMCYNGLAEGFEFTAPDDYCSRGRRKDGGEKDAKE